LSREVAVPGTLYVLSQIPSLFIFVGIIDIPAQVYKRTGIENGSKSLFVYVGSSAHKGIKYEID
jgi:hypothetical protein